MTIFSRFRKPLAAFFLCLFTTELVAPTVSYALTSGPDQPEMKGFTPIGNSDMVDLFSGDFNYNIPLLDVGGYPVNLSYQSGSGMDDEASWVGLGWSLGPGALNRQLRGIPDDFNGSDKQERWTNMKDHITKGGRIYATLKALGIPLGKLLSKKGNFSLTKISAGVKYDNYRGIGFDLGVNAGLSLTDGVAAENNMPGTDGELDLDLNLSSFDGASANINASMIKKWNDNADHNQLTRSIGFGMNSRAGLTNLTLGSSFSTVNMKDTRLGNWYHGSSSSISFAAPTYTPTITHAMTNFSGTFNLSVGPQVFIAHVGLGGTGFYSRQTLAEKHKTSPAYGYYYSSKGRDDDNALLDFNREKDIPFSKNVKALPVPIPTYDLYTASSQNGGGQFRLYSSGSGIFFDQRVHNSSDNGTIGISFGAGTYVEVGGDFDYQNISTTTKKWTDRNRFIPKGDFQTRSLANPLYEPVYFKRVGEPVKLNKSFLNLVKGTQPVAVALPKYQFITEDFIGSEATDMLATSQSVFGEATSLLAKNVRDVKNTTFQPLTAKEATAHGLDKLIYSYNPSKVPGCAGDFRTSINRVSDHRKRHHFSEISVTGDDGKRSVYGIPVYNTNQEEVTFNIGQNNAVRHKGLIRYADGTDNSTNNKNGRDWYFSREKTPPYSTSHLLTAILSPDYVDRSGDGVTDDDLGTAVKFNYTKLANEFRWRTPYAFGQDSANYNEGLLSDAMDDKASYVYGTKEIWYMHSIESKTMVAHFITEDRKDGIGVAGSNGAIDMSRRLKQLKEIRLYSKSDLKEHDFDLSDVTPIKVVHFEYDNSLCTGLPNSEGNVGKLTLKRVYFTFGKNQKGKLNSYQFNYNTTYNEFGYRQTDRWGTFKQSSENPGASLSNSEYPYTLQDDITDAYAANWQLNQIKLPSGGVINVTYESDDYAYVQNRRASEMFMLAGIDGNGDSTNLADAEYIYITTPYGLDPSTFKEKYFDGMKDLYFKFYMDLDNKGHCEYVPGYAKIVGEPEIDDGKIRVKVHNPGQGFNPIAQAGWQFIRTMLPKYAYPESDDLESTDSDLKRIVMKMVAAVATIGQLFTGFDKRAKRMKYSDKVHLSRSWVRLCSPHMAKKGGGSRVQKIEIADDWQNMTDDSQVKTATYTQLYDYTIKNKYGEPVSSGVASYEPMLGNDENPFRQPMRYKENAILGLDNQFYIEEPFGESFFPGPGVGYSKVSVRSIGSGDESTVNRTGEVVSEFYTAKDYPTKVNRLYLPEKLPKIGKYLSFIGALATDTRAASQGISVELNDMHGKPKSVNIYNRSGQKISSQEFSYKSENETAVEKTLDNNVSVVNADGTVSQELIGMDVEIFNDMREQSTINIGGNVKLSGGSGAILWFPLPFFFPGLGINYDKRMFRSSSTVKIVQRFGLQTRVRKMENGSHIKTENMLWDAETGNVLLSKSQNEFDDPIYSFAYPAHWKYDGMAQAYKNLGTILDIFTTNSSGEVSNSTYDALLSPGDELIDVNSNNKYWIIRSPISSVIKNRLINADGQLQQVTAITAKIVRSGRRNMANTAIGTIVSLKNPLLGDSISVTPLTKILDAKATVFSEEWSVPGLCTTCPSGYYLSPDGLKCFKDTEPEVDDDIFGCYNICAGDTSFNYNTSNGLLYNPGYSSSGSGSSTPLTDIFWQYNTNCMMTRPAGGYDKQKSGSNKASPAFAPGSCNVAPERDPDFPFCLGPLNRTGIWLCKDSSGQRIPLNKWIGIDTCINFPDSKTYYVGLGADDQVRFSVDGNLVVHLSGTSSTNYSSWHIYPFTVPAGSHTIRLEGYNSSVKASFGAEIYNNTSAQVIAAAGYGGLDVIFTTQTLVDPVGLQFTVGKYTCSEGTLNTCQYPYLCRQVADVNKIVNPYYKGLLGNWRAKSQYVYQVNRENITGSEAVLHSTDIRKSGAYSDFNPFWRFDMTTSNTWLQNPSADQRWIAANEVTLFNSKGLEVENKDALNRYSSALFGYLESMPVAVASNARYREIAYDGFEDYSFELGCNADSCNRSHFDFKGVINGSTIARTADESHSGKYSLKLDGNTSIQRSVWTSDPASFLDFDAGRYSVVSNEMAKGFSPIPGKKYLISFWLKDTTATTPSTGFQVKVNGSANLVTSTSLPIVEGWKRIEVDYTLPMPATGFTLELTSAGESYIDDIRIMPYDGQMKSFAYDPSSQRLMAEMDENNFATFYEYDDEGTLIRVKKETERGIMTIKETRSSYRKKYIPSN